jgi:ribonuclease HI
MHLAFFDGACSGNPGPMAIRYIVFDANKEVVETDSREIGDGTNNVAEYEALIKLLLFLEAESLEDVQIYGDSKLVVNQVMRTWRINEPHLRALAEKAWKLMERHPGWGLSWIPRECNVADPVR